MSEDDRRLDEARLDEVAEGVVDELRPVLVGLRVDSPLRQPGTQLALVARPELVRLERLDEADAPPRPLQVDLVAAERRDRGSEGVERDLLEHRLDPVHRVAEVGVRLVPLEHRELGLVLVRDALVAEVLADLVHALEPSHDQALEVQLGRDAQVEVRVQLVRVRHERVRERAAVARLEDGRLDLDEPLAVEVATDRRDDLRAQEEEVARLLVHEQVEVALAVARLRVGQAVERVRERAAIAARAPSARRRRGTALPAETSPAGPRRRRRRRGGRRCRRSRPVSHMSWMRPERSTRSRKTSFPISRRAMTRPARRRVSSSSLPASISSVAARMSTIGVAIREPLRSRHGGQPIRPRAASRSGMIQRTQQRLRVSRAVTTSPCSRPS